MTIGLTYEGLNIRSLSSVIALYENLMREAYGEVDTSADSVFGQLIGAMSEPLAEIWEQLENVYHSQYPSAASGISLDNAIQFNALIRLEKTASTVPAVLFGTQGTLVPAATRFSTLETNNAFYTLIDKTIDVAESVTADITVDTVANLFTYEVTINTIVSSFVSDSNASEGEITQGLTDQINIDHTLVVATDNLDGTITIVAADLITPFLIAAGTDLSVSKFGTPVDTEAVLTGSLTAPINTLTVIDTPVTGLDEVTNIIQETTGRDEEIDQELRLRRAESLNKAGSSTIDAIHARLLQNVEGLTDVNVIENASDIVDGAGRPPHSFECTIVGGDDEDIAKEIWESKPAGIQTHGNTSAEHVDTQGVTRVMNFSRPVNLYAHVRVDLTIAAENGFPVNGLSLIQENILAYGETFDIGQDLIIQKFFTPVYAVPGISDANIYLDLTPNPGDAPSYVQANIPVDTTEIANFDLTRIIVTIL